jgi:hypothetical protein
LPFETQLRVGLKNNKQKINDVVDLWKHMLLYEEAKLKRLVSFYSQNKGENHFANF